MGSRTDGAPGALIRELEPTVMPVLRQEEKVDDIVHEGVYASICCTMNRVLESSPEIAAAFKRVTS